MSARPHRALVPFALLAFLAAPDSLRTQEPLDDAAIKAFRDIGLEHSQVMDLLGMICDVHGPRLTGSPNIKRAQAWARDTFAGFGLRNAHLAAWGPFGPGWQIEHFALHVTGENAWPVLAWPKAWSPGVEGTISGEVVDALAVGAEALETMDLADKFVLVEEQRPTGEWFAGTAERLEPADLLALGDGTKAPPHDAGKPKSADFRAGFQKREAVMRVLAKKRPLAVLDRSFKGDYGTLFVQGASATDRDGNRVSAYASGAVVIPQLTLAVEHYNRISRLLARGIPVRLAMELRVKWSEDDPMEHNVIAELTGTDPRIADEVVMLGAHFDSWHSGSGTTDNGVGSAVMMEAIRILKTYCEQSGRSPRRTIRVALWSGEEQGLLGSRAWVTQNLGTPGANGASATVIDPAHAKFAGYFNLDNGTGRIRGIYLQGNEAVRPIFKRWFEPFHDLDAATLTASNTGGTDHLSFDAVGLPGFQFIQDPIAYGSRTHHSNMDLWDHAIEDDLKQAATIIASFVWHTANRDEKLPRKGS